MKFFSVLLVAGFAFSFSDVAQGEVFQRRSHSAQPAQVIIVQPAYVQPSGYYYPQPQQPQYGHSHGHAALSALHRMEHQMLIFARERAVLQAELDFTNRAWESFRNTHFQPGR